MLSSPAGILATPAAAVIGLACFLVSGGLLVFKRNVLPRGLKALLTALLALSILYLLFALWLVVGFGGNSGPAPTLPPVPH